MCYHILTTKNITYLCTHISLEYECSLLDIGYRLYTILKFSVNVVLSFQTLYQMFFIFQPSGRFTGTVGCWRV